MCVFVCTIPMFRAKVVEVLCCTKTYIEATCWRGNWTESTRLRSTSHSHDFRNTPSTVHGKLADSDGSLFVCSCVCVWGKQRWTHMYCAHIAPKCQKLFLRMPNKNIYNISIYQRITFQWRSVCSEIWMETQPKSRTKTFPNQRNAFCYPITIELIDSFVL